MNCCKQMMIILCVCVGMFIRCSPHAQKLCEQGDSRLKQNKPREAYRFYNLAAKKKPNNATYRMKAATVAPTKNEGFIHANAAWSSGKHTPQLLYLMVNYSEFIDKKKKIAYAVSLYHELDSLYKTEEFLGELYYGFHCYDSCIQIWKKLYTTQPSPQLCNKLAHAYIKNADPFSGQHVLEQAYSRRLLNNRGFILLATLYALNDKHEAAEEVFTSMKQQAMYDEDAQLEQVYFAFIQNNLNKSVSLLRTMRDTTTDQRSNFIHHKARICCAYLYNLRKDTTGIRSLSKRVSGSTPWQKAEQEYYDILISLLYGEQSTEQAGDIVARLSRVRMLLAPHPLVDLTYARLATVAGYDRQSYEMYKNLPLLLRTAPAITLELAYVCTKIGKNDEALALVSYLHHRKHYSKKSLELFRDLTLQRNLVGKSEVAQHILEKRYSQNIPVLMSGAVMALRVGKLDSAYQRFVNLATQYPDIVEFEVLRISTLLLKREYEATIAACRKSKAPISLLAPIAAEAFVSLGKFDKAEQLLRHSLSRDSSASIVMAYADFLLERKKPLEAIDLYKQAIKNPDKGVQRDTTAYAQLLNNCAWALLQVKGTDNDLMLSCAKKAWSMQPERVDIFDTYIEVLLALEKTKECINLLNSNPLTSKEPRLSMHLAKAFELKGDANKAIRMYRDAMVTSDSLHQTILPFSKDSVAHFIAELTRDDDE